MQQMGFDAFFDTRKTFVHSNFSSFAQGDERLIISARPVASGKVLEDFSVKEKPGKMLLSARFWGKMSYWDRNLQKYLFYLETFHSKTIFPYLNHLLYIGNSVTLHQFLNSIPLISTSNIDATFLF